MRAGNRQTDLLEWTMIPEWKWTSGRAPSVRAGEETDAQPYRQQDLWDRQRRPAEGDERPRICPGTRRWDAAPQYDSPDVGLRCDRGGEWARRRRDRAEWHPSQSGRNGAWRSRGYLARQLHGTGRAVDSREGHQSDHARVQDFTAAADHPRDRVDQGGRRGVEPAPACRHRRGTGDGWQRAFARPWHHHLPYFSELMAAFLARMVDNDDVRKPRDKPARMDQDRVMDMDRIACYRAISTRDARFDGRLFVGVKTTGIYCRPICPASTAKFVNVSFYPSAAAAQQAGFRPCLRCRPETSPDLAFWRGTTNTVSRALALIEAGGLDEADVEGLANRLGVGARQLRRLFHKHVGSSPVAVAQTRRVLLAKQLIHETSLPMAEVAMASGFNSIRRFNETFQIGRGS